MTEPHSIRMSYLSPPYQRTAGRPSDEMPIVDAERPGTEKGVSMAVTEVYPDSKPTPNPLIYRRTDIMSQRRPNRDLMPMDRFLKACSKQTPFVYGIILTFITAIPFVVFLCVSFALPPKQYIGPPGSKATLTQLAKWLLICWGSFMGLLWIGNILAAFFKWFCGLSVTWVKYQRLAEAICLRFVLLLWAIIIWSIIPSIFKNSLAKKGDWVITLRRAFMFIAIAFAILLVQGIVLELAAVQYIQGWLGPRSQRASDELETIKQLHALVNPHAKGVGVMAKMFERLIMPSNDRDLFYQISSGRGHADMWKEYADRLWDCVSQGNGSSTTVLRQIDLVQQLERMGRDGARGQKLFTQLDESCDGEVTLEEVENLVYRVGIQLNMRARAQAGIKSLLRKLEILLTIVMLGVIFFLYIQIFQAEYSKTLGAFWTGLTGLSFAFGGVLLEFTQACTFVFAKHPYDVGDYIETKTRKFVVEKIWLTHTNFEEVTNPEERGVVVQMSHASLLAEPIVNWTRTLEAVVEKKAVKTKEDEAKEKEKKDKEAQEKEEARQLILLKTESLKHKLE